MEHLKTLADVFSRRMFRVPDYQRGYAWEIEQREDLLQDLEDLELLPDGKQHYTGTLILASPTDGAAATIIDKGRTEHHFLDIVDGQQRIATLILLLEAIHKEVKHLSLSDWADSARDYLMIVEANDQSMLRLTLNADCHDYFEGLLLRKKDVGGPRIRSHKLLKEAREQFAEYMDSKRKELGDGFVDWLQALYIRITQRLTFLIFEADDESDASIMFETMNDRGQQLTELEKVKNYLLYLSSKLDSKARNALSQEINKTWKHIFESLMAADLGHISNENQLLRVHWLMAYEPDSRKWDGSRSIKTRFNLKSYKGQTKQLLTDLLDYVHTLRDTTTAYCDIQNPAHSNAFNVYESTPNLRLQVKQASEKLVRLGSVAAFLPLLMAVRLRFAEDDDAYLETVQLCEKYAFRVYSWLSKRADTGQAALSHLGHDVFNEKRDVRSALNEMANRLLSDCSDRQFEAEFDIETERDWYRWSGRRYFLYEYEETLARKAGIDKPKMSWEQIEQRARTQKATIEHILPQNPKTRGYWTKRFSKGARETYTDDIGNLCLTYYNPSLGNRPFPEKKGESGQDRCYASSVLLTEQRLAKYDDWTEKEILARRNEIKKWALERWHVDEPPPQPPPGRRDGPGASRSEKLAAILALADECRVGNGFRAILETAERCGLHPRPEKNCVWYAPPSDRRRALFTVWLDADNPDVLTVWLGIKYFPELCNITKERVRSIMGDAVSRSISDAEGAEFASQLALLFGKSDQDESEDE